MKKLLLLLTVCAFSFLALPNFADAQIVKSLSVGTKDSLKNTDTLIITLSLSTEVVSITPKFTKASGTVAGKCYLQASVDGSNWVNLDSLVFADQTTNIKTFSIGNTVLSYVKHRLYSTSSGTCEIDPVAILETRRSGRTYTTN